LLRKKQYEKTDEEMLEIAKNIILLKTKNQLNLLKSIREKETSQKDEIKQVQDIIDKIQTTDNPESLL
jgi:CRISPR/Cas system-associated endonuclease Cas1